MTPEIAFRPAGLDDAEALFLWRNDPITRRMAHVSVRVGWDEHVAWLKAALANPGRQIFMASLDGAMIGTVRADHGGEGTMLSWAVAPEARGRGFGKHMVAQFCDKLEGRLLAEIKAENEASKKIALFAGMRLIERRGEIELYERMAKTFPDQIPPKD